MSDYRIEKIPVGKLLQFVQITLTDREHYSFLPISPERALAQSKNPAASEDDIGLILIYDGNKCIGYRGLIPCWVKAEEKIKKVCFPSTIYIAPEYRGKYIVKSTDIKQTLVEYIISENTNLGYDFITTGFNDKVYRFHSRINIFRSIPPLPYLRINVGLIAPFSSAFKKLSQIKMLKPIRRFLNLCSHLSRSTFDLCILLILRNSIIPVGCDLKNKLKTIPVDKVLPLEKDCENAESHKTLRLYRDESIINWMIQYPWIKDDNEYISKYYFAKPRERFDYLAYHLMEKKYGKHLGYVVYSISTEDGYTTLKILDYKTVEKRYEPYIIKLAMDISRRENVNVIEGSHDFWRYLKDRPLLRKITGHFERKYFIWGKKDGVFEQFGYNIKLDYCDCDQTFT